jgi:iron(III) transport system permease protein
MAVTALLVAAMRNRSYVSLGAGVAAPLRYRLGAWQPVALLFAMIVIGLAVAVPLLALLVSAGHWTAYVKALTAAGPSIGFSLLLATGAAALMTLLALFAAVSIQQAREPWRTLLHYLSQVPFAVPAIVLGIGMIRLWNRPATDWLYGTPLIIVLGYCAHYIPFAVRAVHANLLQVHPHLLEAARLAGVTEPRLGLRILLPLLRNGLLTAFFITFVLSLGELGVTLLVTPPGTTTIPITIYNYMHYGAEATVSALCLILIAITLLIGIAVLTALRRPIGDAR